jgi:hypothetical protein
MTIKFATIIILIFAFQLNVNMLKAQSLDSLLKEKNQCINELFKKTVYEGSPNIKCDTVTTILRKTITIDSLNFKTIRLVEFNGEISQEATVNMVTRVGIWRIYNKNRVVSQGFKASFAIPIGIWIEIDDKGKMKFVDYEVDRIISFCDFSKIAAKNGFLKGDHTYSLQSDSIWALDNWDLNERLIFSDKH